jgi:hypothetical protein
MGFEVYALLFHDSIATLQFSPGERDEVCQVGRVEAMEPA